jgi:SH3-like domain-containing protein
MRRFAISVSLAISSLLCLSGHASAQDREVPYWASLAANEVNMRVGPSERFPIDWVYRRQGLPVKVVRLQQGWRLIEEVDGTRGWVFNQLLSLERHAIVVGEGLAELRSSPGESGELYWNVEPGVIGRLGACDQGWCEFDSDGRAGWMREERLWGPGQP